jgi:spore coat protein H
MKSITMRRKIHCWRLPVLFLVWAVLLAGGPLGPLLVSAADSKAALDSDLFDGTNIVRISITIPDAGMNALRRTQGWGGGNGMKRPETKATVTDGTRTYNEVAIHLKGAAGSFRPVDDKPGLTLNFDKFVKGQTFHGLEKLSLNNSNQDPSYLCEKMSREIYRKAGVPVPRTDYALVTLNGKNLGLYVLAEGYNKQFLGQFFKKNGGNLYDGGFCQEITGNLALNSGDNQKDRAGLDRLIKAVSTARESNDLDDLREALDVDRFITMTALDILFCHWDGYALNRNNYRIYHDPETDKMVFMPHGLDQLFGRGRNMPDTAINPHMNGMVARAVMGTRAGRALYQKRLQELRTNYFQSTTLIARARELEARLQAALPASRRSWLKSEVNEVCRGITEREDNLERQMAAPPGELKFDSKGIAVIGGWKQRNAVTGSQYNEVIGPDKKKYLQIVGDGASSSASWRTRAMLPTGKYRFEGMVRTKSAAQNGTTVVLRISGARDVQPIQADAGWVKCGYEFEIEEAIADIELVAEMRPAAGEVWFDANSLRIVRLSNN